MATKDHVPEWIARGKTVRQLIAELKTFENQDCEVRISLDCNASHHVISLVGKDGKFCVLMNCEAAYASDKRKIVRKRAASD